MESLFTSPGVLPREKNMNIAIGKLIASGLTLTPLVIGNYAIADVGESFYTLGAQQGEREIEFITETVKKRGEARESAAVIGFGYGITDYWFTEISAEYAREAGGGTGLEAFEWENIFRLTEPDRFPVDIGLVAEIERPRDCSEGYKLKFGPLFQKDIGRVRLNANLLFERHFSETLSRPTEMGYQWQAKYGWRPTLAFGLQGFGEMGPWDDWAPRSEQSHRFGPAVFGKVSLGGNQEIEYKAAYLTDPSSRARSHGFRIETEYKF
jgi:hypothetical protein